MPVINISCEVLKKMIADGVAEVIDIREPDEYEVIRMKGSKLIPMHEFPDRLDEIDWNKQAVFVCRTGIRSEHVAEVLASRKDILNLSGGIKACYLDENCKEIEKTDTLEVEKYFS